MQKKNKIKKEYAEQIKASEHVFSKNIGLYSDEVETRIKCGLVNKVKNKASKSYLRIILENLFTIFTVVMYGITAFLIICKIIFNFNIPITKFTFLLPMIANIVIGTFQQCRSKYILDKLNLVNKNKYIVIRNGSKHEIFTDNIVLHDLYELTAGQQIPTDAIIYFGSLEVNEAVLTGESNSIFKNKNDKLLSGSYVISGNALCIASAVGNDTYVAKIQSKMKEINENKSELMKNINSIIKIMTFILILVALLTTGISIYKMFKNDIIDWNDIVLGVSAAAIGCVPNGLVLLTSVTLAVSVISLSKKHILVQDLYSLEHLSHVDTICLDKTGTLTTGTMSVQNIIKLNTDYDLNTYIGSFLGSLTSTNQTIVALLNKFKINKVYKAETVVPFSSERKMTIVTFNTKETCILGAPEYVMDINHKEYNSVITLANKEAEKGFRVLCFSINGNPIALICLNDDIRKNASKTIKYFYENNVDVKIISGDNPFTVAKIAKKCGVKGTDKCINMQTVNDEDIPNIVDKFVIFGRITPEQKEKVVKALQAKKHKVAMTGDGVNDVLALKAANCSISFNTATESAKNISDVVLLDDSFDYVPDVVLEGRKVVNNITRTAILFLSKTIFIVLFSLFSIFIKEGITILNVETLYIFEFCVVCIGGMLLSVEPNRQPIIGTFKKNVYPKALVNGLFLNIAAITAIILYKAKVIETLQLTEALMCIMISIGGFAILYRTCLPLKRYRIIVFIISLLSALLLLFGVPDLFLDPYSIHGVEGIIDLFKTAFNIKESIFAKFTTHMITTVICYSIVCLPIYVIVQIIITYILNKQNKIKEIIFDNKEISFKRLFTHKNKDSK